MLLTLAFLWTLLWGIAIAEWKAPWVQQPKPAPVRETHRGGPEPEPMIAVPLSGVGSEGLTWGDIAAIVGLLTGFVGGIQWLIMRAMIEPAITRASSEIKAWAEHKFPSSETFHAHETADALFQARVDRENEWIRERLSK